MELKDGIYHVRTGNYGEKVIQVPKKATGYFWRYSDPDTGRMTFVPVVEEK